jgi:hypothetical protein
MRLASSIILVASLVAANAFSLRGGHEETRELQNECRLVEFNLFERSEIEGEGDFDPLCKEDFDTITNECIVDAATKAGMELLGPARGRERRELWSRTTKWWCGFGCNPDDFDRRQLKKADKLAKDVEVCLRSVGKCKLRNADIGMEIEGRRAKKRRALMVADSGDCD